MSEMSKSDDTRILRNDACTNPGGARFVYEVGASYLDRIRSGKGDVLLRRLDHEAIKGLVGDAPNLHPRESEGRVILEAAQVERDFIRI